MMRVGLILMLMAGVASAQSVTIVVEPNVAGMIEASQEAMVKKLRAAPDAFLRDAAKLIYGYGAGDGIDKAGINTFIAMERAGVRARAMAAYLSADIDNDGEIVADELEMMARAMAAPKRGALWVGFGKGDADRSLSLSQAELRSFAQNVAIAEISEDDALRLQGLMAFDLDGNGIVTMPEVTNGVGAILDKA